MQISIPLAVYTLRSITPADLERSFLVYVVVSACICLLCCHWIEPCRTQTTAQHRTPRNETKRNETRKKIFAASLLSFASGDRSDCARFCAARRATAVLGRCELGSRGEPWLVVRTRLRAPILYRVGQRLWAYPCGVCLGRECGIVHGDVVHGDIVPGDIRDETRERVEWRRCGLVHCPALCTVCSVRGVLAAEPLYIGERGVHWHTALLPGGEAHKDTRTLAPAHLHHCTCTSTKQ